MSAPTSDRPPQAVLAECRTILAEGSKSFSAASRLLPARLRDPVTAFYAFCRVSDDAVDESDDPERALVELRERLDAIVDGRPGAHPADRAMAWVMRSHQIPRAPVDALLEGYAWDVEGRAYETLGDVRAYGARVAASVGVVMTLLMGSREPWVLHRAADLGVAMQLTNIARDVGEDARAGRIYLPLEWLRGEGIEPERLLARPRHEPGIGVAVCRLLDHAEGLYRRARLGVAALPVDCRLAIAGAAAIYADIGRVIRARSYDSVSRRAYTSGPRKVWLMASSAVDVSALSVTRSTCHHAPPLPEVRFLMAGLGGPEE